MTSSGPQPSVTVDDGDTQWQTPSPEQPGHIREGARKVSWLRPGEKIQTATVYFLLPSLPRASRQKTEVPLRPSDIS